jgi:hypothetical protein
VPKKLYGTTSVRYLIPTPIHCGLPTAASLTCGGSITSGDTRAADETYLIVGVGGIGNLPSLLAVGSGHGGGFRDTRLSLLTGGSFCIAGVRGYIGSGDPIWRIGGACGVPFKRLAGGSTLFGPLGVRYRGGAGTGSVTPWGSVRTSGVG